MDIPAGSELVLAKEPLNLKDMFADSMSADERSDRETGKITARTICEQIHFL